MNDIGDIGIGHNRPPEPIELTAEDKRIADLVEAATKWSEQYPVIETEDIATACTDYINQLDAQWEEFDNKRKAEREPHSRALKAIQEKYLPWLERIDICRRAIKPLHRGWLKRKDARLKAEREAAEREAVEAQRRSDQLAEQATSGDPGTVTNMIVAAEAAAHAQAARQAAAAVPRRAQVRGALGGRTHSLTKVWRAAIGDQDALYRHFRSHPDVTALLYRLANAAVRAADGPRPPDKALQGTSAALPGVWIFQEEV